MTCTQCRTRHDSRSSSGDKDRFRVGQGLVVFSENIFCTVRVARETRVASFVIPLVVTCSSEPSKMREVSNSSMEVAQHDATATWNYLAAEALRLLTSTSLILVRPRKLFAVRHSLLSIGFSQASPFKNLHLYCPETGDSSGTVLWWG